jgi:hypothetical protein
MKSNLWRGSSYIGKDLDFYVEDTSFEPRSNYSQSCFLFFPGESRNGNSQIGYGGSHPNSHLLLLTSTIFRYHSTLQLKEHNLPANLLAVELEILSPLILKPVIGHDQQQEIEG